MKTQRELVWTVITNSNAMVNSNADDVEKYYCMLKNAIENNKDKFIVGKLFHRESNHSYYWYIFNDICDDYDIRIDEVMRDRELGYSGIILKGNLVNSSIDDDKFPATPTIIPLYSYTDCLGFIIRITSSSIKKYDITHEDCGKFRLSCIEIDFDEFLKIQTFSQEFTNCMPEEYLSKIKYLLKEVKNCSSFMKMPKTILFIYDICGYGRYSESSIKTFISTLLDELYNNHEDTLYIKYASGYNGVLNYFDIFDIFIKNDEYEDLVAALSYKYLDHKLKSEL